MISFFESLLPAEFIRAFALTLFHSLWQGALLAILVAILILALRKYKPAVRYAVLYLVLVLTPVMFVATFLMIFEQDPLQTNSKAFYTSNNSQDLNQAGAGLVVVESDTAKAFYLSIVRFFENNARLFVLIWMTGFFLFLIRFSGSIFYVYRLKNYHIRHVDEPWNITLRRLSEKLGLKKTVRLAESGLAKVPMTIGYLKPVILLPIGTLSGVPPQQIDAILLHELAHILRKDYLLNLIQSVIELLFFYHPLTWWLSGLIRQEREHICDDLAVEINQDHINYIKALTTMEELNSKSPLLASAITGSRKKLLVRVKRLLTPVKIRKGSAEGIIVFLLLISLVFALSFNALSIIPSSFDLSGRESGERIYNFLPFNPEIPDTITATSSSGKVKISVYTDSASQLQQEQLQKMAESMDKQSEQKKSVQEKRVIYIDGPNNPHRTSGEERKMVVITKADSIKEDGDSIIVIYNEGNQPERIRHYNYRGPDGHPAPAHAPEWNHSYSNPGSPESEDVRVKVFSYKNDSIDTQVFIGSDNYLMLNDIEELELNSEELEDLLRDREKAIESFEWYADEQEDMMRDIQIDIERDIPEGEMENLEFYFNEPVNPPMPPGVYMAPEPRVTQAEKIIRQELRDDELTERGNKYVIELDSKAMYINGEKQPKEVYRKYRRLVESLESITLDSDTYKIIF